MDLIEITEKERLSREDAAARLHALADALAKHNDVRPDPPGSTGEAARAKPSPLAWSSGPVRDGCGSSLGDLRGVAPRTWASSGPFGPP